MAHPMIRIAGLAYSAYEYLKDAKKAYAPEKKKKPFEKLRLEPIKPLSKKEQEEFNKLFKKKYNPKSKTRKVKGDIT